MLIALYARHPHHREVTVDGGSVLIWIWSFAFARRTIPDGADLSYGPFDTINLSAFQLVVAYCQRRLKMSHMWRLKMSHIGGR